MSVQTLHIPRQQSRLDDERRAQFERSGFLVLPGFLPADLVARLKPEVDRWVDTGLRARSIAAVLAPETHGVPEVMELDLPAHGELLAHQPLLRIIEQLMGPRFAFHHMHSDRHAPDLPGKPWHHDYEQRVQSERTYSMVHTLHYLDGMDPDMAGLALLPGSHREIAEKDARGHLGTEELPGEVYLEDLPPAPPCSSTPRCSTPAGRSRTTRAVRGTSSTPPTARPGRCGRRSSRTGARCSPARGTGAWAAPSGPTCSPSVTSATT